MKKVVTFGEVLMRLSPSGNRKLLQATSMNFFFGGTEMNVAASLAYLGLPVQHVTNLSNDFVGEAALSTLRKYAIDVSAVRKINHPLGLYFLEVGASMRPSQISYNRQYSAFANISPDQVDWDTILEDCMCFHWTGISPAISEGAYLTLKEGLEKARAKGITVTADPTYRSNLWKYGKKPQEVLAELLDNSSILVGGVDEINEVLGTSHAKDNEGFIAASKEVMKRHSSIERVFDKVRNSVSASWQRIQARCWTGEEFLSTRDLEITDVVDRIGTGDAFAAGVIYGIHHYDDQKALEFANAACALKHTNEGDVNLVTNEEVMEVVNGNVSGRIKR